MGGGGKLKLKMSLNSLIEDVSQIDILAQKQPTASIIKIFYNKLFFPG